MDEIGLLARAFDGMIVRLRESHELEKSYQALINEVLDLARIESNQMTLSTENVAVNSMIVDVITLNLPMAETHGVSIANQTAEQPTICTAWTNTRKSSK